MGQEFYSSVFIDFFFALLSQTAVEAFLDVDDASDDEFFDAVTGLSR